MQPSKKPSVPFPNSVQMRTCHSQVLLCFQAVDFTSTGYRTYHLVSLSGAHMRKVFARRGRGWDFDLMKELRQTAPAYCAFLEHLITRQCLHGHAELQVWDDPIISQWTLAVSQLLPHLKLPQR